MAARCFVLLFALFVIASSQLSDDDDCAVRQLAVEYAAAIQPNTTGTPLSSTNWPLLVADSLQTRTLCPSISTPYRQRHWALTAPTSKCDLTIFVDGRNGSDDDSGSEVRPLKTVQRGVALTRRRGTTVAAPCIIVRAGVYFFGDEKPRTFGHVKDSQLGAIQLTAADSGLTITAAPGETVIFSGGQPLTPDWSVYKVLPSGTVFKTPLPPSLAVDAFHFNELYIDGRRAVRAKYPNGDPSTHGLYSQPDTGYIGTSRGWLKPATPAVSVEIHNTSPRRLPNNTFAGYQMGVEGIASIYDPPQSFWALAQPPAGGGKTYAVPRGVMWNSSDISPRIVTWSKPETGYVHTFHGDLWGSWIFDIESVDPSTETIYFGQGGWQESRGNEFGGTWYISNILEELDAPNEWFVDSASHTLYYMINASASAPKEFVASQLPCILSLRGTTANPLVNVTINGIVFAHTSNTFMRQFSVPSPGDWAIHRGAAIVLTATESVTLSNNLLTQLGSNALLIMDYNKNATIISNEFAWIGDSAIILTGSVQGINGVSSIQQPTLTNVINNLIREVGIYCKQAGPFFQAITRSTRFRYNVVFNHPRSAVNFNDGFYGDHEMAYNLLCNSVRETTDHGPFNSWDRQPYLTLQGAVGPSLNATINRLHHNLIINNYGADWPLDHDDNSNWYNDYSNVMVFGGYKSSGRNTTSQKNLYLFPDSTRPIRGSSYPVNIAAEHDRYDVIARTTGAICRRGGGESDAYMDNHCLLCQTTGIAVLATNCNMAEAMSSTIYAARNHYYFPANTQFIIQCEVNKQIRNLTLSEYQQYGYDVNSTQSLLPAQATWVRMARDLLNF